jgi:hypothetical protein
MRVLLFSAVDRAEFYRFVKLFFFFLDFPIYLQSVYIHSNKISKLCDEKRGRVEECSVAPLRNERVKNLCGCRGKKGTN